MSESFFCAIMCIKCWMKKIYEVLTHPVTYTNLLLLGSLGLIQVIHTNAHLRMKTDVHAYCSQNMEYQESLTDDEY